MTHQLKSWNPPGARGKLSFDYSKANPAEGGTQVSLSFLGRSFVAHAVLAFLTRNNISRWSSPNEISFSKRAVAIKAGEAFSDDTRREILSKEYHEDLPSPRSS